MFLQVLGALFLLGFCVFIHELGHLIMGWAVGAKARIFSIGYGRGVWKREINGTTWQITAIPLGGYVQFYGHDFMSDEPRKPGDFMALPPLRRLIPVLGGPLFNLILGGVIYLALAFGGIEKIDSVAYVEGPQSPAALAGIKNGDKILEIGGEPTPDFQTVREAIAFADERSPLKVKVERDGQTRVFTAIPGLSAAGSRPYLGLYPAHTRQVMVGEGPEAQLAPLEAGDVILAVNGKPVDSFGTLTEKLSAFAGQEVSLTVERKVAAQFTPWESKKIKVKKSTRRATEIKFGEIRDEWLPASPAARLDDFSLVQGQPAWDNALAALGINSKKLTTVQAVEKFCNKNKITKNADVRIGALRFQATVECRARGLLGIPVREKLDLKNVRTEYPDFAGAIGYVGERVASNVSITARGLGLLVGGKASAKDNLAGPLEIAKQAGTSLEMGIRPFFEFMAYISVILMFMNLLPLPVVDGGHVVFFLIEAIRGRPLPLAVMETIMRVGLAFLLTLGVYVMINDVVRNLF